MSWGAIVVGGISAGVSMYQSSKNRKMAKGQYEDMLELQAEQQSKLDAQKEEYKQMEFKNPYAGMTNRFANMENVFEDLTVNQQGAQQRANIMQSMRGAAGSSGVAGLAQALANQGALQTQRISASIGSQEARNQALAAKGASSIQTLERQGAAQVDLAKMGGEQFVQQAQMDRQATLLGMQMGETAGANEATIQSQANQMNAQIASQQATMDALSVVGTAAGEIDFEKEFGSK